MAALSHIGAGSAASLQGQLCKVHPRRFWAPIEVVPGATDASMEMPASSGGRAERKQGSREL